jgi:hypothetical protein
LTALDLLLIRDICHSSIGFENIPQTPLNYCQEVEHYDGTMNQIHFLSFITDVKFNKVFTYKKAMTQEDAHLLFEAMQKEVADHEMQYHWTIVCCSTVPITAKLIQAI